MKLFLTDYLNLKTKFEEEGIFDPMILQDNPFYINLQKLKKTTVEEFKTSIESINQYFNEIIILLSTSNSKSNLIQKEVNKRFIFKEINETNLGVSKGNHGRGIGKKLAMEITESANTIIKAGIDNPIVFQLLPLFQENIGADRLSDMLTNIIKDEIEDYTLNMMIKLNITKEQYSSVKFKDGFLLHPIKETKIYLLPIEILHAIPLARNWMDIDYAVKQNRVIRKGMSSHVLNNWAKYSIAQKKNETLKNIIKNSDEVISKYSNSSIEDYNLTDNNLYFVNLFLREFKPVDPFFINKTNSLEASVEAIMHFKNWLENQGGTNFIHKVGHKITESIVQELFKASSTYGFKIKNFDLSPETNKGRGYVDFKVSKGSRDITVIEFKLSSNQNLTKGYFDQLEQYAKSEETKNKIYVIFDLGNTNRIEKLKKLIKENNLETVVIIINMNKTVSASKL